MSVEECPYCGKAFKRLKSHLPYCKMAPVAQPPKSTQTLQDIPKKNADTPKQKIHKKISTEKDDIIFDERQTSKNRRKDDKFIINKKSVYNADSSLATTQVTSFERPKSKWSAKRQKEQKSNNSTSLPDHERDKSFRNMSKAQAKNKPNIAPSELLSITKITTTTPAIGKSSSLPAESSLSHENPTFTVMEEIKPNSQSSDINQVLRVKEPKALSFFTSKTSVWDHIKGSLYCNQFLPGPVLGTQKASAFETKDTSPQQANKIEATLISIQRPVEDVHSLRLQSVKSLGWNPEIMTSFRILFSTQPFRNSSNDNTWKTRQFFGPSSHDKGWQWYYTKYIDVRRGGIGGISLLFAGYCVLCYIWRYPYLKEERWRKYH